jgi:hypothetical protein
MKEYLYISHWVRWFVTVCASGEFVRSGEVNKKKAKFTNESDIKQMCFPLHMS